MTSPAEKLSVECPKCGHPYETIYRPSMNLAIEDFDQEYVREMSTGECPKCGHVVELETLVVDTDGTWRLLERSRARAARDR